MDLYGDTENLISSDEGSGDDEERLLNVSVQVEHTAISDFNGKSKYPRVKTLLRRKQATIIFKKRAVKWLNNKQKRDVYKRSIQQHVHGLKARIPKRVVKKDNVYKAEEPVAETICLDDEDELLSEEDSFKDDESYPDEDDIQDLDEDEIQNVDDDVIMNIDEDGDEIQDDDDDDESETQDDDKDEINDDDKDEVESIKEDVHTNLRTEIEKSESSKNFEDTIPKKRKRSTSPLIENNAKQPAKPKSEIVERTNIHDQINKFFSDRDELIDQISKTFSERDDFIQNLAQSTDPTINAIDKNMSRISSEIKTINEVMQDKEKEWNRLLHLKKVKEEVFARLARKRSILETKDKQAIVQKFTLPELKELELYLAGLSAPTSKMTAPLTVQQLIENRANMNKKDLEMEAIDKDAFQSVLSAHFPPNNANSDGMARNKDTLKNNNSSTEPSNQLLMQYLEKEQNSFSETRRPLQNVRIFDDIGKKKLTNASFGEKRSRINEPFIRNKTLYNNEEANPYYESPKQNFSVQIGTGRKVPFCQECNKHESRFVCAGCENQWYCSRSCQVSAWDRHSESCND